MKSFRFDIVVLAALSLLFFISSGILAWNMPIVFNSPDENANAVFASTFGDYGHLWLSEPLNVEIGNVIHPRSVLAVGDRLVPSSFLGLPTVYGLIVKGIGLAPARLLTPLLAILAIFAWRSTIEVIFRSRAVAFFASLAVLFHPGFWYYAGRSFMHNVPFVSLLMIGVFFAAVGPVSRLEKRPDKMRRALDAFLAGLFIGLALFFRTFEAIWVVPLCVFLAIIHKKHIGGWGVVLSFALGAAIALTPMLFLNTDLYGGAFETGYTVSDETSVVSSNSTTQPLNHSTTSFVLPFGLSPKHILRNAWSYSVLLFPWLSIGAFLGFLLTIGERWKERKKDHIIFGYVALSVLITGWLWLVYGSWVFNDNPDPRLITIGNSYVRYWLPMYILASPFLGAICVWIGRHMKTTFTRRGTYALLSFLLIGLSIHPVFFDTDGLATVRQNLLTFDATRDRVLALTEPGAVIVVDRADKFLWPERRVVQPLRSETTYQAMPALVSAGPLYYFGITFPLSDLVYLNDLKLKELGLSIEHVETIGEESLYRIYAPAQ